MADNPTPPGGGQRMQRMIQPTPLTGAQILWCAPPAKTQFVRKKSSMDLVMAPSNLDVLQSADQTRALLSRYLELLAVASGGRSASYSMDMLQRDMDLVRRE